MLKLIALIASAILISCNSKTTTQDCYHDIPEEGEKKYIARIVNRDGTKSIQEAIVNINITSRYDSSQKKRLLVIDTLLGAIRPVSIYDSVTKTNVTKQVWMIATRDSVELLNPIPIDSLLKK